jgi:cell wall integrity and stress response component
VTNVQVVTQSGVIVTQTVTTTPTLSPDANSGTQRKSSTGIAPGYIAVAVIAGIFSVLFICAGIYLCWRRRNDMPDSEFGASSRDMQRNVSVHSKAGLLANRTNVPVITTRLSNHGLLNDDGGPSSPMSERRKSQPMMYDQRLNPNALMQNENGSHTSLKTLDDHRDYGRTLLKVCLIKGHKI